MIQRNRKTAIFLAMVLALSLLLTGCGKGGDNPTGDNSTPGAYTLDTFTPASTETPDGNKAPDTSSTPEINKVAEYEAGGYVEEYKTALDSSLADVNRAVNIDVESVIEVISQKYGEYLSVNITKDAIKVGVAYSRSSPHYKSGGVNLTGISPNALKDVNDFLTSKGETMLDEKNPEQNIAALWLATSLYYDPDVDNGYPAYDIAMPFGLARADSSPDSAEKQADIFWSPYVALFNLLEGILHY